jgi:hypothetical protein
MGFPEIVPPEVQTQAFHLSIDVPSEADCLADMLVKVLPEFTIEIIHRKEGIVPRPSRARGDGSMHQPTFILESREAGGIPYRPGVGLVLVGP